MAKIKEYVLVDKETGEIKWEMEMRPFDGVQVDLSEPGDGKPKRKKPRIKLKHKRKEK